MTALAEAVEGLYDAFAHYPLNTAMTGCPCCVDQADIDALVTPPLRELTVEQLNSYASMAVHLWGSESDYLHFLPRILELTTTDAAGSYNGFDWEIVIGPRLKRIGIPDALPKREINALRTYVDAAWTRSLQAGYNPGGEPKDLLESFALIHGSVSTLTRAWEAAGQAGAYYLAQFLNVGGHKPAQRVAERCRLLTTGGDELLAWLSHADRELALFACVNAEMDDYDELIFARAIDVRTQLGLLN